MVCRKVFGFIFLFKWEKSSQESPKNEADFESDIFFAKQEISNACATQAILHILLNSDGDDVQLGPELSNFVSFAKELPADMRGLCLSNSLEIRQAHNEFGNLEEYLAFGDEEDDENDKKKSDPFHFVAFIEKNETVYELDGLKDGPIRHARPAEQPWTATVLDIIKDRIKDKQDIRFNLMAVVQDQRELLRKEIEELNKEIEATDSGALKGKRFTLQQDLDAEEAKWNHYRQAWSARKKEVTKIHAQPKVLSAKVQDLLKSFEAKGLFKNQQ